MTVIAWLTEGTWQACINAAREFVPPDRELALLHVTSDEITDVAHGAFTELWPHQQDGARGVVDDEAGGGAEAARAEPMVIAVARDDQ